MEYDVFCFLSKKLSENYVKITVSNLFESFEETMKLLTIWNYYRSSVQNS